VNRPNTKSTPRRQPAGTIDPGALYRLDEACGRLGWGDRAMREARLRGLKVHRSGKRLFVLGADILAFVTGGKS
jgi:hypothetical protein